MQVYLLLILQRNVFIGSFVNIQEAGCSTPNREQFDTDQLLLQNGCLHIYVSLCPINHN